MLYELRIYDLKAGSAPAYLDLFVRRGIGAVTRHLPLGGYWLAESGPLNRLYHLWIYESLSERDQCRRQLAADDEWVEGFVPEGFAMIVSQTNLLMSRTGKSAALDAVEASRRQTHRNLGVGEPTMATSFQYLTREAVQIEDQHIAQWRIVSGHWPGQFMTLHGGSAFASVGQPLSHILLRPISCSPLR
ncbi:NIPSNAP family protein [Notoacmeibacter sp. MSK16QG-6]|uniref:NIPSNAP family protein n=1 Tax=Notoacmeibacter sp. MSK16QG-6 TaxID=2957982 RepID=UPI00209D7C8C|nr:NIPSNAP family protein [Notoacmeibacter sp. MSK16QG-6]MCP1198339.1 NIPSNAP family protein [Notoacmeibacter sp. MSK16QG-6]